MKKVIFAIIAMMACSMPVLAWQLENNAPLTEKEQKKAEKEAEKQRKKAEKAQKKAIQEQQDSLEFVIAEKAVKDRHFVVTADRVRFRRGNTVNVNYTTNFVLLQGDDATVQLAFDNGMSGYNGLGGITVVGKASNIKINYDKKGNLVFSMSVLGTAISADISFTLPKNSSRCDAVVDSSFYPSRITFSGKLHPYNSQNVFKGLTIP